MAKEVRLFINPGNRCTQIFYAAVSLLSYTLLLENWILLYFIKDLPCKASKGIGMTIEVLV